MKRRFVNIGTTLVLLSACTDQSLGVLHGTGPAESAGHHVAGSAGSLLGVSSQSRGGSSGHASRVDAVKALGSSGGPGSDALQTGGGASVNANTAGATTGDPEVGAGVRGGGGGVGGRGEAGRAAGEASVMAGGGEAGRAAGEASVMAGGGQGGGGSCSLADRAICLCGEPVCQVGDVEGDFDVDLRDYQLLSDYAVVPGAQAPAHPYLGDTNCDFTIDSEDARRLGAFLAGQGELGCPEMGDVDGSGSVDGRDVDLIESYRNRLDPFPFYVQVADMNCDGRVDGLDGACVARRATPAWSEGGGGGDGTAGATQFGASAGDSGLLGGAGGAEGGIPAPLPPGGAAGRGGCAGPALGDVDGDCDRDAVDALRIAQHAEGKASTPFYPRAADVDCNFAIDSYDAQLVANFYVDLMPSFLCPDVGDVDGNGTIDASDALAIAQQETLSPPFPFFPQVADADCDGDIDEADATNVEQFVAGSLSSLGCEY